MTAGATRRLATLLAVQIVYGSSSIASDLWEEVLRLQGQPSIFPVTDMVVDPDRNLFYVSRHHGDILCVDNRGSIQARFPGRVTAMQLLPNGNLAVTEPLGSVDILRPTRHRLAELDVRSGERRTLLDYDKPILSFAVVDQTRFLLVTENALLAYESGGTDAPRTVFSLAEGERIYPPLFIDPSGHLWFSRRRGVAETPVLTHIDLERPHLRFPPVRAGSFSRFIGVGGRYLLLLDLATVRKSDEAARGIDLHDTYQDTGRTVLQAGLGFEVFDLQRAGSFVYCLRNMNRVVDRLNTDSSTHIYRAPLAGILHAVDLAEPTGAKRRNWSDVPASTAAEDTWQRFVPPDPRSPPPLWEYAVAHNGLWMLGDGALQFFSFLNESWTRLASTYQPRTGGSLKPLGLHEDGLLFAKNLDEFLLFDARKRLWLPLAPLAPVATTSRSYEIERMIQLGRDDWLLWTANAVRRLAAGELTLLHEGRTTACATAGGFYVAINPAEAFLGTIDTPGVQRLEHVSGELTAVEYDSHTGAFWIASTLGFYEIDPRTASSSFHPTLPLQPSGLSVLFADGRIAYVAEDIVYVAQTRPFSPAALRPQEPACTENTAGLIGFRSGRIWYQTSRGWLCGVDVSTGSSRLTKVPSIPRHYIWQPWPPRTLGSVKSPHLILASGLIYNTETDRFFVPRDDPFPPVKQLVEWHGRIYAATKFGVFEVAEDGLVPARSLTGALSAGGVSFLGTLDGSLWIDSERGLYRVDRSGKMELYVPAAAYTPHPYSNRRIEAVAKRQDTLSLLISGQLWTYTPGVSTGMERMTVPFGGWTTRLVQSERWMAVQQTPVRGRGDYGVYLYDGQSWKRLSATKGQLVIGDAGDEDVQASSQASDLYLLQSRNGLWVRQGEASRGPLSDTGYALFRLDEGTGRFEHRGAASCPVERVQFTKRGRVDFCTGNIWMAHDSEGVPKRIVAESGNGAYSPGAWSPSQQIVGTKMTDLLVNERGGWTVATDHGISVRKGFGRWRTWLPSHEDLPWTVAVQPGRRFSLRVQEGVATVTMTAHGHRPRRMFVRGLGAKDVFALSRDKVLFLIDSERILRVDFALGRITESTLDSPVVAAFSYTSKQLWVATMKDLLLLDGQLRESQRIPLSFPVKSAMTSRSRPFFIDKQEAWLWMGQDYEKPWLVHDLRSSASGFRGEPPLDEDEQDVLRIFLERRCGPESVIGDDGEHWWVKVWGVPQRKPARWMKEEYLEKVRKLRHSGEK